MLTLNLTERLLVIKYLNESFKGNLEQTALAQKDIVALVLTQEEKDQYVTVTNEQSGQVTVKNDGTDKDFDLSDVTREHVKKMLEDRNEKGDFVLTDPFLPFYQTLLDKVRK